jgi:glyoxylase-like metal-dependent hydrolase (beta-lactamase superfamily II)
VRVHALKVGQVDCWLVDDGSLAVPPEILFPRGRTSTLATNGQGLVELSVICLLLRSAGQVVLVDAGNGTRPGGRWQGGGRLLEALAVAGVEPSAVDVVLFTHGHTDHVGGSTSWRDGDLAPTFPRARHLIARADWDYFTLQRQPTPPHIVETLLPLRHKGLLEVVEPDVAVTPDVDLLAAPGHTPGNSVVRVHSAGQALYFLGDLVHHVGEVEDLDLMPDGDVQRERVPESRRVIFERAAAEDALVAASHFDFPGIGRLEPPPGPRLDTWRFQKRSART